MNKGIAGLAGALAVSAVGPAQGAIPPSKPLSRADAYAKLLEPIQNAVEELKAADAAREGAAQPEMPEQLAQYGGGYGYPYYYGGGYGYPYYHHHHHHNYWRQRRWYHHHHHHHHHNWWGY